MSEQEAREVLVAVLGAHTAQQAKEQFSSIAPAIVQAFAALKEALTEVGKAFSRWMGQIGPVMGMAYRAIRAEKIARAFPRHAERAARLRTPALSTPAVVLLLSERCGG